MRKIIAGFLAVLLIVSLTGCSKPPKQSRKIPL